MFVVNVEKGTRICFRATSFARAPPQGGAKNDRSGNYAPHVAFEETNAWYPARNIMVCRILQARDSVFRSGFITLIRCAATRHAYVKFSQSSGRKRSN